MNYNEPDHELQKMVYCQIQELRFEYSFRKPPHIRVGLVANMQEVLSSLTIIYFHILQFRLVYRPGHQSSAASYVPCRVSDRTTLQALATHYWWARSNLALHLPLMQEFKRFQFAIGQRYAAMCTVLVMFAFFVPTTMWN